MLSHEDRSGRSIAERDAYQLGALADADSFHADVDIRSSTTGPLLAALRTMVRIRTAEAWIGDRVAAGEVKCPCHLAIGQEAAAVGVASSVEKGDRVFGAHRSHAHFLALGGSMHGLFAEVLGKDTGVSGGMGGSMHLLDLDNGLFGTVPIVGATIPIATGAGLAARLDGGRSMAVSFFGDGATEEGVFHESMNLAAVMRLPVLFVCENNLFSSHLHITLRQPADAVSRYATAHRVPSRLVDGNDIIAVRTATEELVASIRAGEGPGFLELVTYRWRGHVGPREDEDVGVKRKDDLNRWKRRDPVRRLEATLLAAGAIEAGEVGRLEEAAIAEATEAWGKAVADPFPPQSALLDRVYTRPSPSEES